MQPVPSLRRARANLFADRADRDDCTQLLARRLSLAENHSCPLIERVRQSALFSLCLDDYFADVSWRAEGAAWVPRPRRPGVVSTPQTPGPDLRDLVARFEAMLHDGLAPSLADEIRLVTWEDLSRRQQSALRDAARSALLPLLTPLVVDAAHPFPRTPALSLNVAMRVASPAGPRERFICVSAPARTPTVFPIGRGQLVTVDAAIAALLPDLLGSPSIRERSWFRVTRRAHAGTRRAGDVSRLEVDRNASRQVLAVLQNNLGITATETYLSRSTLTLGVVLAEFARCISGRPPRWWSPVERAVEGA